MPVTSAQIAGDAGKYIDAKMLELGVQVMKLGQFADPISLPSKMGLTVNFTRDERMGVILEPLTEGVTPAESTFSTSNTSVTANEYGHYCTLTNVSLFTTEHPIFNRALKALADAMGRSHEYMLADILSAGTNVQYQDGLANRAALTTPSSHYMNTASLIRAAADLDDKGATERQGGAYAIVMHPNVIADLMTETGDTSFRAAALRQDLKALYQGVVTQWQNWTIIKQNFLPKLVRIATFSAPSATTGGSLSGTVYHKITRRDVLRGFEEGIQVEASTAMGANNRLVFTAPSTSGYVYRGYVGSTTGDSNLYQAFDNLGPSESKIIDAVPTSGTTPPATPAASVTVYQSFGFAEFACDRVDVNQLSVMGMITAPPQANGRVTSDSDPIGQRRKVGNRYAEKYKIRNGDFQKTIETLSKLG